jgi:hypothetical protein
MNQVGKLADVAKTGNRRKILVALHDRLADVCRGLTRSK